MDSQFYFLSPVEVVKVSSSNLEEVAEWCGGRVAQTESRRVPGRMDSYVWVPTPKGSNISWAFPGMFITKRVVITLKGEIKATWAVFRRDYFEKNYFNTPNEAVEKTWDLEEKQRKNKKKTDAAEASEPVQEPKPSTADVEAMTDEEIERIEQQNLAAAVALVERELGGKVLVENKDGQFITPPKSLDEIVHDTAQVPVFKHNHMSFEGCVEGCPDRYVDGVHEFIDKNILGTPDGFAGVKKTQPQQSHEHEAVLEVKASDQAPAQA